MTTILTYEITGARPADLQSLATIELAAASLLAGHAPDSVLAETTSRFALEGAMRRGQLWVARASGKPVGFAHVEVLEAAAAHLEEIDVHPEHGRRGVGRQLIAAVCDWATVHGYRSVTLTTFRDVPWNMPFYARLGFEEIPRSALGAVLRSIVRDETRRGLDPARRVAMRRPCAIGPIQGA
jgi:GNAT superfamily N-acetyltransferase